MPPRGCRLLRYLFRIVLVRAALAAAILVAMYVIIDTVESASSARVPLARIAALYLFKLPQIAVHVAPVAAALAVVLALGALERRGERDAAAAAGLGPGFLLVGLVAVPCALAVAVLPLAHELAPRALSRFEEGAFPRDARRTATSSRWIRDGARFVLLEGSAEGAERALVALERGADGRTVSWSGPCGEGARRCGWRRERGWLDRGGGDTAAPAARSASREPAPTTYGLVGTSLTSAELLELSDRLDAQGQSSCALRAELALRNAAAAACVIVPVLALLLALASGTSRDTRLVGIAIASAAAYWLALSLAWNGAVACAVSPSWIDVGVPLAFAFAIAAAAAVRATARPG
jgi:lipopolysaccharide export LptBFGC system permease protein LptF